MFPGTANAQVSPKHLFSGSVFSDFDQHTDILKHATLLLLLSLPFFGVCVASCFRLKSHSHASFPSPIGARRVMVKADRGRGRTNPVVRDMRRLGSSSPEPCSHPVNQTLRQRNQGLHKGNHPAVSIFSNVMVCLSTVSYETPSSPPPHPEWGFVGYYVTSY